jgi:SAM-dependent methyltransferase
MPVTASQIRDSLQLDSEADTSVLKMLDTYLADGEMRRMNSTLEMIPRASNSQAWLLDIGGSPIWIPGYLDLGYRNIAVLQRGEGFFEHFELRGRGESWQLRMLDADAELDPYPLNHSAIDTAVCFELLEHMAGDPMHVFAESNRVLRPGGALCLSTPNVASSANLVDLTMGRHPYFWSAFTDSYADRHNREYVPAEIRQMFELAGFTVSRLVTARPYQLLSGKRALLGTALALPAAITGRLPLALRGEQILARGTMNGPVLDRYPGFLYELFGQAGVSVKVRTRSAAEAD